ncbi:probable UDP-sugar transporter protein SLC35A4 isoform X2 [Liolophura sinensis]|uniref:probable UDP-sugar transporter protein SLC35A4 isoform X2 n=1 Tax=Liolophura sinensis TaxID=3198878 RepID=UPI003158332F
MKEQLPFWNPVMPVEKRSQGFKAQGLLWQMMLLFGVFVYGSYTILVHLCEEDGQIPFSSSSAVLLIEVTKMILSLIMHSPQLIREGLLLPKPKICLLFLVPAMLYCINNNIAVHMQLHMDPTTYQVLGNMKIATTAVLYRMIIKRHLTRVQWFSLFLLTLAGICDSYGGYGIKGNNSAMEMHITPAGLALIFTYCVISGFSGVYTEFVMKKYFQLSLHVQNILLYSFGIVLNFVTWMAQASQSSSTGESFNIFKGYSFYTWIIILTQAANGLIMSAVMKHASNITRLFIISCAMLVTTVLSVLVFHITLNVWFVMAFILVLTSVSLYHR